jgi:hypothetical protein
MALVTPRSSNRAIFAPIAPHPRQPGPVAPSGGSVDARFAVSGLCRFFLVAEPRRNLKNSDATDLLFTIERFIRL